MRAKCGEEKSAEAAVLARKAALCIADGTSLLTEMAASRRDGVVDTRGSVWSLRKSSSNKVNPTCTTEGRTDSELMDLLLAATSPK